MYVSGNMKIYKQEQVENERDISRQTGRQREREREKEKRRKRKPRLRQ
jgi:hypothetical protein